MASGNASVVPGVTIKSDANGSWSVNLIPSSQLVPYGMPYKVTRTYPRRYENQTGKRSVVFIVVPPSGPVNFESIIASAPDASPLTDTELGWHLAGVDPHPQYLTEAEVTAQIEAALAELVGSDPAETPDATSTTKGKVALTHDFGGDADAPEVVDAAFERRSASLMGALTEDWSLSGHKSVNQAKGEVPSDGLTGENMADHVGDDDPHAAALYPILLGGGRHLWVTENAPTTPSPQENDLWIKKSSTLLHVRTADSSWQAAGTTGGRRLVAGSAAGPPTSGSYVKGELAVDGNNRLWTCAAAGTPGTWVTEPRITVSATAPSSPLTNDLWVALS